MSSHDASIGGSTVNLIVAMRRAWAAFGGAVVFGYFYLSLTTALGSVVVERVIALGLVAFGAGLGVGVDLLASRAIARTRVVETGRRVAA